MPNTLTISAKSYLHRFELNHQFHENSKCAKLRFSLPYLDMHCPLRAAQAPNLSPLLHLVDQVSSTHSTGTETYSSQ
jgi:hypothetical protein